MQDERIHFQFGAVRDLNFQIGCSHNRGPLLS